MKKLFVSLAMVVMMFAAGVALSACGSDNVKLTFSVEKASEPLVKVVVKQNNQEVEGRGYNYNLKKGVNLRVELVAKTFGVDFSQVVVKVDGAEKSIIKNKEYDCSFGSENLVFGNFTLAGLDKDSKVTIAGVKESSVSYDFEVENLEDETAIANMKSAFIDVDGNDEYQDFYEFVTNPESKIEKSFTQENFNSFRLRFGNADRGDVIFDLDNSDAFRVKDEEGNLVRATFPLNVSGGYYTVTFPNITQNKYTIVVDFKQLNLLQYTVIKPDDNLNYSISAPEFLNYESEGVVTVSKSTQRQTVVYDEMKVCLNELELQLDPTCDIENDSVLRYLIPSKITPFSTSIYGDLFYTIRIENLTYTDESFAVKFSEDVANEESMFEQALYLLDDAGQKVDKIPLEGGEWTVVKGEKVALYWEYKYDQDAGCFVSKYDLFDFDVVVGDVFLIEENPNPPTEQFASEEDKDPDEKPDEKPEEPEPDPNPDQPGPDEPELPKYETINTTLSLAGLVDMTTKQTQTIEIAEGYLLTAFYDEEKGGFYAMQVEFSCENNKVLSFANFKNFGQDVNISFAFEDARIATVEYNLGSDIEPNWILLERNVVKKVGIEAGQKMVFRLGGTSYVDIANFEAWNELGLLENPISSTYTQNGIYYTELIFTVSYLQPTSLQEIKLVSTRG